MRKFEIGKKYSARSICDHNCIWIYEVISRTAKFITLQDDHGKQIKCKIYNQTGICDDEFAYPEGRFSMCPVLRPEHIV